MKKILIWGTGQLSWQPAKEFLEEEIIGYIDSNKKAETFAKKKVFTPYEVVNMDYDAIIVSTIYSPEIKASCAKYGIDPSKLIYSYGNVLTEDINENYEFVEEICGKNYADQIKNRYHLIREIDVCSSAEPRTFSVERYKTRRPYYVDYIRIKTFELLVDEITKNNVSGNVAELGVFKGEFAQFINSAFPERILYLFDTFEGFREEELQKDSRGQVQNAFRDIFKNTTIEEVMEKMEYKNSVMLKKGFFPESLQGLEDKFAFVSLDCDWEESLYQGIKYFYPRLSVGGYVMIHDYNNALVCAKRALKRYEEERHISIPKVPICDTQGSIILTK